MYVVYLCRLHHCWVAYIVTRDCVLPGVYLRVDECPRERISRVLLRRCVNVRAYALGNGIMQY